MIVAGFGFRASATVASFASAYENAKAQARISGVTHLASLDQKASAPEFRSFSRALQIPVVTVDNTAAQEQSTITVSEPSKAAHGLGSVAEAVAVAASMTEGRLAGPRCISDDGRATCAIFIGVAT